MLQIENLSYEYITKNYVNKVLDGINDTFEKGKMYAVLGKSGSGKSTLLAMLAALDKPSEGRVLYEGMDIQDYGIEKYRSLKVAIIFQEYNLLPYYNAFENVKEVLRIQGNEKNIEDEEIRKMLDRVEINDHAQERLVSELSGGERQRVAIARALISGAEILLADEPTGNLDFDTAERIVRILQQISHEENKCVIMVTHDERLAEYADEQRRIEKGYVFE